MAGIGQYLKDTHGELRHVAWPTQTQTVVYTILVAIISIIVAVYLGLFDYLFTSGIGQLVGSTPSAAPASGIEITPIPVEGQNAPQVEFNLGE